MAFSNTKPHMSLLLAIFLTCFLLLLNQGMSKDSIEFTHDNLQTGLRDITFPADSGVITGQALYGSPVHVKEKGKDKGTDRVAEISTTFDMVISKEGDRITFLLTTETTDSKADVPLVIDIKSVTSVLTLEGKTVPVPVGSLVLVTIKYFPNLKQLTVSLSNPKVSGSVTSTHTYNNLDLTSLPEWVRVGFSGVTKDHAQIQSINSWSFSSNLSNSGISKNIHA